MLMQLDNDHDGKLQPAEAPPRLNARIFAFMDSNKDGALESSELAKYLRLFNQLRSAGNNIDEPR